MAEENNLCKWLLLGSTNLGNRPCVYKYCLVHLPQIKHGSLGPKPCLKCGIEVRVKISLCVDCGSKKYRGLKQYYD